MLFLTHIWTVVCSPNSLPSADPLALVCAQRPGLSEACHSGGCSSGTGLGEHTFAKSLGHDFQKRNHREKGSGCLSTGLPHGCQGSAGKSCFFSFCVVLLHCKKKKSTALSRDFFPFPFLPKHCVVTCCPFFCFFPHFLTWHPTVLCPYSPPRLLSFLCLSCLRSARLCAH